MMLLVLSLVMVAGRGDLIDGQGIGPARVGMSYSAMKKAFPAGTTFKIERQFMVDFDAMAVRSKGKVLMWSLFEAGATPKDSDKVEVLITEDPRYRTAQGIGPGTPLDQAVKVYGRATLDYDTDNESREYIHFARLKAKNISFQGKGKGAEEWHVGIYGQPKGSHYETHRFKAGAVIRRVLVMK